MAHRCLATLIVLLLQVSTAMAGPWLNADDLRLRYELLLLADAGLISAPLTSWPIPVADMAHGLQEIKAGSLTSDALRGAYDRVQVILSQESVRNTVTPHVRLAATNEPIAYRGFAELQRE